MKTQQNATNYIYWVALIKEELLTVFRNLRKTGVQIFTSRQPDDRMETQDVLAHMEKYPLASLLYLEFLIHDLNSEVGMAVVT